MIVVEGDHNSPRPKFMFDSVSIFLQTCLQIPNSWALNTHPGMNLMAPPWSYPGVVSRPASTANRQRPASSSGQGATDEIGMTAERQREIQASLFKMLGQQDDETGN
mmetsp:Transcript_6744/g.10082  ORF Transcript_6744/g.10082 Transcript_6744/m.10082 type:complete len:107 (-) Transcript_6744:154-474(-)